MQPTLSILVLCAVLRCAVSITFSLENNDNLEEAFVTPKDEFGRCIEADSIDLSSYNINHIRNNLLNGGNIASIYLNSNNIQEIPKYAFKDVKTLVCLDFSENRIPIEKLLDFGHKTVKALDLSNQRAYDSNKEWSDRLTKREKKRLDTTMFSDFPNLRYLDISGNPIYGMPKNLSTVAPQLTHIYIKNRNFADLSDEFFDKMPKSLKSLHIENNKMENIDFPENLPIEGLFFDGNPLLPGRYQLISPFIKVLSLSNCTLETLHLYDNEVSSPSISNVLPGNVPNLESLDLSWNKLKNIQDLKHLSTYNRLGRLSLSHNEFNEFPVDFTFTALEKLSMSYNKIFMIPNRIHGFPSLKMLNLRGNKIESIQEEAFTNMVFLQDIDLSDNNLELLPAKLLNPLTNLHLLDVRHNKFVKIIDIFGSDMFALHTNSHLTHLYVKSNALKTVDSQELEHLPASCIVHTC